MRNIFVQQLVLVHNALLERTVEIDLIAAFQRVLDKFLTNKNAGKCGKNEEVVLN